ncbi:MAG TPA: 50S ribosomal protein L15 [Candidatus Aenigmarchaeota archaeon]|nr:50S ribosomal protein L15 [Candidatus Aenigmarchaeota archaeon]
MGKKKARKMRGSRSHGYGRKKRHKGAGNKGDRGMAGSKKHKKLMVLKKNPDYFVHKKLKKRQEEKVINLKDLSKFNENKINLKELGYTKLLGDGEINRKIEVIVEKWSKQAEEKIKKAGGIIKKVMEKEKK